MVQKKKKSSDLVKKFESWTHARFISGNETRNNETRIDEDPEMST